MMRVKEGSTQQLQPLHLSVNPTGDPTIEDNEVRSGAGGIAAVVDTVPHNVIDSRCHLLRAQDSDTLTEQVVDRQFHVRRRWQGDNDNGLCVERIRKGHFEGGFR
jgi:transcription initiation factor TFIID subunit TAF12